MECTFVNKIPEDYRIEAYLVDDGCTDGTADAVCKKYAEVHIIKGDGTLYWNRGMWTAWNEAAKEDYDYYLWLNDDTYLHSNALCSVLEASAKYDEKAIVVGATEASDGSKLTYGGRRDGHIPNPEEGIAEVDYFNGNLVLVPKYAFLRLGNLDYTFRHSKGDFDYGKRARKSGIRIIQTDSVVGICDLHPSLDKWCNPNVKLKERLNALNTPTGMNLKEFYYYDRKHKGSFTALFHMFTITLHCLFPRLWHEKE